MDSLLARFVRLHNILGLMRTGLCLMPLYLSRLRYLLFHLSNRLPAGALPLDLIPLLEALGHKSSISYLSSRTLILHLSALL